MRPVSQKNIIAVDFLRFEAHLSRALYGGMFWEGVYVQLIAAKRLRSLISVKRDTDDPTRPGPTARYSTQKLPIYGIIGSSALVLWVGLRRWPTS